MKILYYLFMLVSIAYVWTDSTHKNLLHLLFLEIGGTCLSNSQSDALATLFDVGGIAGQYTMYITYEFAVHFKFYCYTCSFVWFYGSLDCCFGYRIVG